VLECRDLIARRGRGASGFSLRVDYIALHAGEVLAVLGPNGSGKTTLLRALAGLDDDAAGAVTFPGGGPVTLVFQRPAAFSGSVAHNVGAALLGRRLPAAERARRGEAALARFEIGDLAQHDARTLSGGELRRLALARAAVLEPRVLLLDEPFDDLDAEGQRRLSLDLGRAVRETDVSLVVVTHDLRRAMLLADRIAVLIDGALAQQGPRDEVLRHPTSPVVARTVGMSNLLFGRVVARVGDGESKGDGRRVVGEGGLSVPVPAGLEVDGRVWVGIRPEHLKIDVGRGDGERIGEARVDSLVSDGASTVVGLSAGPVELTTYLLANRGLDRRLSVGDRVPLAVRPEHVHAAADETPETVA
jgi:ABC-type sulfate/molybdate transport systems ATPase subunit